MYVNASIELAVGSVLAVPEDAVFRTGTQQIVFVDKGQGLFEPRSVVLGVNADGYAEVRDGLSEGERVVASGNFLIDSESRLKAALEGASAPGHQHGQ
jgi:Cu(I)/Ag(I) efflux system membrane fusion protein